jgi:hypothetical protein
MKRSLILALLFPAALPVLAEDAAGPLRRAERSAELYALGLAQEDPVLLLTAAELRKSAGLDLAPEDALSWQQMLAAAGPLIAGDAALEAMADDLAAAIPKGVAAGPVTRLSELAPGETVLPAMGFKGGTLAEVYVEAAPGVDVNLTVRDAAGNLVCRDSDASFVAYCTWTPARDGDFTLVVENRGQAPIDYTLMTN